VKQRAHLFTLLTLCKIRTSSLRLFLILPLTNNTLPGPSIAEGMTSQHYTNTFIISTSLSISIASKVPMVQACHLDRLSVRKVYCDKPADWRGQVMVLGDKGPPAGSMGRAQWGLEVDNKTNKRTPITMPNFDHLVWVWRQSPQKLMIKETKER